MAKGVDDVYVATCDEAIVSYVRSISGKAVMTSDQHTRATGRTAEALGIIEINTGERVDIVIMVQGDEPLIPPEAISQTVDHFDDPEVQIVNIMSRLRSYEAFLDKNNVKVVADVKGNALYFSREPIPSPWKGWQQNPVYMQTGIIAFRREALLDFNNMEESPLELIESVDMNRILEVGKKIRMVPIENQTIGVDTKEELIEAEKHMMSDKIIKEYLNYF